MADGEYKKIELMIKLIDAQERCIKSTIYTGVADRRMAEMEDSIKALSDLISRLNIKLGMLEQQLNL